MRRIEKSAGRTSAGGDGANEGQQHLVHQASYPIDVENGTEQVLLQDHHPDDCGNFQSVRCQQTLDPLRGDLTALLSAV